VEFDDEELDCSEEEERKLLQVYLELLEEDEEEEEIKGDAHMLRLEDEGTQKQIKDIKKKEKEEEEKDKKGVKIQEPSKRKGRGQEKPEEIKRSMQIASERIVIEQSFGRVKNSFKFLQLPIPTSVVQRLHFYLIAACHLCNHYREGFGHRSRKGGMDLD